LNIVSCLPLPELLPAPDGAVADVMVEYGEVPAELPGALERGVRYQSAPGAFWLRVDEVATFLVRDGRRVTIAREAGADDDDVRLFLMGSVFGALLHQRDDLVLHGSAIVAGEACVALLGQSGAGKSTLAAAFRQRGYPVLTDDLCVVRAGAGGRLLAQPGVPQAKLWPDSLEELNLPADGLRRIRRKLEKRAVPLGADFATTARPMKKIYLLGADNKEELALAPAAGPRKFSILKHQTYRFGFLAGIDDRAGHFQLALRLAQGTPVGVVRRTNGAFRLKELADLLEADFRA